jgi:hypothetical protein
MGRPAIEPHADVQPGPDPRAIPFRVGDAYPDVMTPEEMQQAFRIKRAKFYQLVKRGIFDRFEIKPRIGHRAWSGALVAEHIRSAGRSAFVFGRRRA